MRKATFIGMIMMVMGLVGFVLNPGPAMAAKTFDASHAADMQATRTGKVFTLAGTIKAIDAPHHTAVVVSLQRENAFTVGGPLAQNAVLQSAGKPAALKDFHAGQKVLVTWQAVKGGHLILGLKTL